MIVIYYLLALIAWCFGAIFLILFSFKKKYRHSLPARFFLFKNPKFSPIKVHFHACSFGEIRALAPLIAKFKDSAGVSVITQTGFNEALKITQNTRFLPFEIFLPFWLKKTKILVIFEAELWFMLVAWAKFRGSRVILINARISDRSYKRYLKFRFFYHKIFKFIDKIYAQSELDKERLISLGAQNIIINGNIKSAFLPSADKIYAKPNGRVIVLASTHANEEAMILKNLNLSKNDFLIIAPRHPERFDEVAKIAQKWANDRNFSFAKFSQSENFNAKCTLIDKMGELINIYAISDVVVLGGSFIPNIGGHNPFEAAQFKNAIISGEFIFNQKSLFKFVKNVKFAKAHEIDSLLKSDLKISQITQNASAQAIIKEIKDSL